MTELPEYLYLVMRPVKVQGGRPRWEDELDWNAWSARLTDLTVFSDREIAETFADGEPVVPVEADALGESSSDDSPALDTEPTDP